MPAFHSLNRKLARELATSQVFTDTVLLSFYDYMTRLTFIQGITTAKMDTAKDYSALRFILENRKQSTCGG